MTTTTCISRTDADGIVTLTFDDPTKSVNMLTSAFVAEFDGVLGALADLDGLRGVILASAKATFVAGADVTEVMRLGSDVDAAAALADDTKRALRRLETLGVPVVALLDGSALGGGLELALAAHRRICSDRPGVKVGLPEVGLGLLPGGGGVVRVVRLLGLDAALDRVLLSGKAHDADAALSLGLIDEVVPTSELHASACQWIADNPAAVQPWDNGDLIPGGGANDPRIEPGLPIRTAALRASMRGAPMDAQAAILCAAVEGAQVDLDSAFAIETRYFVGLATGDKARNIIQGTFLDRQVVRSGASRPAAEASEPMREIGVVGAGMMGAGIALAAATKGIRVQLVDVDLAAANRGHEFATRALSKEVAAGRRTNSSADEIGGRIRAADDYAGFGECDAIIEAVFEDPGLKGKVLADVAAAAGPGTLLASNTSTLPIAGLAESTERPECFIGLHFFSPAERMELVEIVVGPKTSDATLARAFDFVRQLGKLPIVVGDGRGFFTSRVILARLLEAAAMVGEGIAPTTIERASQQAGYPIGTLALLDEVTLSLPQTIYAQFKQAAEEEGRPFVEHPGAAVLDRMLAEHDRAGRAGGGGFYDYEDGHRKALWSGLGAQVPTVDPEQVNVDDLKDRLLFAEALETARCLDSGLLRSTADANVGSLLGIGYPKWTGGTAQFVDGFPGGVQAFVARADELAAIYGSRFEVPVGLRDRVVADA